MSSIKETIHPTLVVKANGQKFRVKLTLEQEVCLHHPRSSTTWGLNHHTGKQRALRE